MGRRVVFFQPRTFARPNYQNSSGQEQRWVPWFALALSPVLRSHNCEIELLDARISSQDWRARLNSIGQGDIFAVSVMTGHAIKDALEASAIAQEHGAFVVWGGPHITLFHQETLDEAPVDAVIPGFGYIPFYFLINHLFNKSNSIEECYGVLFKDRRPLSGHLAVAQLQEEVLPPQDLDLISDWEPYINADIAIAPRTINFITSEGCPRHCTFCSEPATSGRIWYTRPIEQSVRVASDLIARAGANGLKLHDPNFFHNTLRALVFAKDYSRMSGTPWAATIYPDDLLKMPDDELSCFAAYGLSRVLVGLESPLASITRLAGKQYNPADIPIIARRLAKAGIRGMFTFIVGWPGADHNHYEATVESAYGIRAIWSEHQAKIHFLEPWPGTPIYRLVVKQGFVSPKSLLEWSNIDYYQAQFMQIHDVSITDAIRRANAELSPYVDA